MKKHNLTNVEIAMLRRQYRRSFMAGCVGVFLGNLLATGFILSDKPFNIFALFALAFLVAGITILWRYGQLKKEGIRKKRNFIVSMILYMIGSSLITVIPKSTPGTFDAQDIIVLGAIAILIFIGARGMWISGTFSKKYKEYRELIKKQ